MSGEKRNTKSELADTFKQLLKKLPMEKITIKEICEMTGVIRPTFYNHFSDKYELLEYVIRADLLEPIKPLLVNDMITEALTLLFNNIKNDKDFYDNAVRIEGQNSFESIARDEVSKLLIEVIDLRGEGTHYKYKLLSRESIATYYAQAMCYVAITWIKQNYAVSPKELADIYDYLTKTSMLDVISEFI